jgi:hypothetical protein
MYGIYANIGGILMVNVTIYSIHGSYGLELLEIDVPRISISIVPIVNLRVLERCEGPDVVKLTKVCEEPQTAVRLCRSHPGPEEAIATAAHQPLDVVLE